MKSSNKLLQGNDVLYSLLTKYYEISLPFNDLLCRIVLESTYFVHPKTVFQTDNLPIFNCIRYVKRKNADKINNGVFESSNFPPNFAFISAYGQNREESSTTLCHIYSKNKESHNVYFYTNLANLCVMPTFLNKFSDTDGYIRNILEYCSFKLYSFNPYNKDFSHFSHIDISKLKTNSEPVNNFHTRIYNSGNELIKNCITAGCLFTQEGVITEGEWIKGFVSPNS